jgi:hypothetical protein
MLCTDSLEDVAVHPTLNLIHIISGAVGEISGCARAVVLESLQKIGNFGHVLKLSQTELSKRFDIIEPRNVEVHARVSSFPKSLQRVGKGFFIVEVGAVATGEIALAD